MSEDAVHSTDIKPDIAMSDDSASPLLGKRKRGVDDYSDGDDSDDNLFMPAEGYFPGRDDSEQDSDGSVDGDSNDDDEGSDNVSERGGATQIPYSESTEIDPPCAAYDSGIADITMGLVGVPQRVIDVLSPYAGSGKHIDSQLVTANKALAVPKITKVRIGLLGDAGAGKSSVLNSITGITDLANSLSGGQSCTCVPTTYTDAFQWQHKVFAAGIQYFQMDEIREMLAEMLKDYYHFVFEYDRDWDEDQRTNAKRAMQNALKTFRVLFCHLKQFKDDKIARQYLEQTWEDKAINAIDMFLESCEKQLKDKITENNGYAEFVQAASRSKLRDLLDPLTGAKTKSDKPGLWPLVRSVSIGIRGCRVLQDITIVDLPGELQQRQYAKLYQRLTFLGISDTNEFRKEMCKEQIRDCDRLWVVAPIKRVVDEGSVFNLLSQWDQRFKKSHMAVICTHADDGADRKLAKFLDDEGCEMGTYFDLSRQWKDKKKEVTKCKNRIKALRNRKGKQQTKPILVDIQHSEDRLKALLAEREVIDANRFEFLVKARATFVTDNLREEHEPNLPTGPPLAIFCVSNSHYTEHKAPGTMRGPRLSVIATGIPALRSYALVQPAPLLMKCLDKFADHRVSMLLKSAHMWVDTTVVERRNDLLELVLKPQKLLEGRLQKHKETFKVAVDRVSNTLNANKDSILQVALKKLGEKAQKHHCSVRAFIRKNGNHSSKVCPKDCWNESFTRAVHHIVTEQGPEWESDFLGNMTVTKDWIISDLQHVLVAVEENFSASALPMDKITGMIEAQIAGIGGIFDDVLVQYQKDFGNIVLNMTQDSRQNYFSSSMRPIYSSCVDDYGKGVTKRSLDKVKAHLEKTGADSPFAILQRLGIAALLANDEKHINQSLMAKITKIFKDTHAAFNRMLRGSIVESPGEIKARLALKAAIPRIMADLDSTKANLLAVKQKYAAVVE